MPSNLKVAAIKSWNVFAAIWNTVINVSICVIVIIGVYHLIGAGTDIIVEQNIWALIKQELSGGIKLIHALLLLLIGALIYWAGR
jgi:hypothetical protein